MRPLIAIVGRRATNSSVLRFSGTIAAETLLDAVLRAGGEPVILHGGADLAAMPERLAAFDGVVLPGGGDLNPACYCASAQPESEAPDDRQDAFDLAVIRASLASSTPMLAICRGLQVLNVACGGTLRQHISDQDHDGETVEHKGARHPVTLAAGSRLRRLAGADEITVSSYHHQAVDRLGGGLRAVACAPDGCVEAMEHPATGTLAVQWHPEDLAATHAYDQALFDDLVTRARAGTNVPAR
jgi:putative glutamine amidotransferase